MWTHVRLVLATVQERALVCSDHHVDSMPMGIAFLFSKTRRGAPQQTLVTIEIREKT